MHLPTAATVPSESTIEQLSNHELLQHIAIPSAWIFVPTRPEERTRGFDASSQNTKILIIQYKRLHVARWGTPYILLNSMQHKTLVTNFPAMRSGNPYVFYGAATFPTYADLDSAAKARCTQCTWCNGCCSGSCVFESCIFFSAHDVPVGVRRVDLHPISGSAKISFTHPVTGPGTGRSAFTGCELASKLRNCVIGRRANDKAEEGSTAEEDRSIRRNNTVRQRLSILSIPLPIPPRIGG
jgi:hypothetical protein